MTRALDCLLLALVHGTAVAAIAWGLEAVLKRRISPALLAALWAIALAKFFLPIGPSAALSLRPALAPRAWAIAAPLVVQARSAAAAPGLSWPALLVALYLCAIIAIAAHRFAAARRLLRSLEKLPAASPALLASVREAATALGLSRLPAVRVGDGPFVAGLWRPTLVIPFERGDSGEARAMLLHELSHLRRGDPWLRALQNLARLVFFFWPPVHWVSRKLEQYCELACDQVALEHGALTPAAYARVLLEARRTAMPRPWQRMALEMSSRASQLETRIDMLLQTNVRRPAKWTALAVLCGAALALSGSALALDGVAPIATVAATPDGGAAPDAGAVDPSIAAVVQQHRAQIRACYESAIITSPELEGTLVFGWTISPAGAVSDGCVESSDLKSGINVPLPPEQEDKLWHCISKAVFSWQFAAPKGGAKVDVSYPFVFKPAGPPYVLKPDAP